MIGYGTYNLPPGTFSDDASLTFCLAEALTVQPLDLSLIAANFLAWYQEGYWTPYGEVFDIGIATQEALKRILNGTPPEMAGGTDEYSNGNGSLMRIAPLLFYLEPFSQEERFRITRQVSAITHGHIRCAIACHYYLEFARLLREGQTPAAAFRVLQEILPPFFRQLQLDTGETARFDRLLHGDLSALPEEAIHSSGYVLHTLEASIWSLLTTGAFREAVLRAVNLGEDTDTTGAVTGALAGLYYGYHQIPGDWVSTLARSGDIEALTIRLADAFTTNDSNTSDH